MKQADVILRSFILAILSFSDWNQQTKPRLSAALPLVIRSKTVLNYTLVPRLARGLSGRPLDTFGYTTTIKTPRSDTLNI